MREHLREYEAALMRDGENKKPSHQVMDTAWMPPLGICKLNTNVAMGEDGTVGLGMVVRDVFGDILMTAGANQRKTMDVKQAEATSILHVGVAVCS